MSEFSETVRIAVQEPGYIRIGSMIVSVLSVLVPMIILIFVLILGVWYLFAYLRRFRKKVKVESTEAHEILVREFSSLQNTLHEQQEQMINSRKTKKLTKAESEMVDTLSEALTNSRLKVEKEIDDITDILNDSKK
jgi:predicted Holliday junction resolvase-like endonuclease